VKARIRKAEARDEPRWRELFDGYTRFYEREPAEALKRHVWARLHDPASAVRAIVAEDASGSVIGFANYVLHESTGATQPVCYLQDLFVDPQQRGAGAGRAMIDWLVEEMQRQGWARLYWNTKEDNHPARALYDTYTPHSGFVRYVINAG
jgi:GNAT superfamily N-acetyltransferase